MQQDLAGAAGSAADILSLAWIMFAGCGTGGRASLGNAVHLSAQAVAAGSLYMRTARGHVELLVSQLRPCTLL
jgi:hypothetical protein